MAKKVLIVDDDDIIRESLNVILDNRGFECEQAANGEQALEILKKKKNSMS